ncbi:hypothetical protein M885DRAFT_496318 [Pelagophyceae sp. CCMP2097]|nr:hypothetical protein M885DRAFT_496318 [Pelagophyceae sp. CCMP2097]
MVEMSIRSLQNVTLCHLLAHLDAALGRVFQELDAGGTGLVTAAAWANFVAAAARERLRYLKVRGLLGGRCYWGRRESGGTVEFALRLLTCGANYPPGFFDLAFYVANNDPFLAVCLADADHPFTRAEQGLSKAVLLAYSFLAAAALEARGPAGWAADAALSVACISAPLLALDSLIFYLLACPCLHHERQRRRNAKRRCAHRTASGAGRAVALALFVAAVVAVLTVAAAHGAFARNFFVGGAFVRNFVVGVACSFLAAPCVLLAKEFNLAADAGWGCGCDGGAARLGFGRWARERRAALEDARERSQRKATAARWAHVV